MQREFNIEDGWKSRIWQSEKIGCMRDFLFTIICIMAFPYIEKARECIFRMIGGITWKHAVNCITNWNMINCTKYRRGMASVV